MEAVSSLVNRLVSEQATGIKQQGSLKFWSEGVKITKRQARKFIKEGKEVAIPSAGAGSYNEVFEMLGYSEVKVVQWSSSAGDWEFAVKDKTGWRIAGQDNRYPHYGFTFWVSSEVWGFSSYEDLVKEIEKLYC